MSIDRHHCGWISYTFGRRCAAEATGAGYTQATRSLRVWVQGFVARASEGFFEREALLARYVPNLLDFWSCAPRVLNVDYRAIRVDGKAELSYVDGQNKPCVSHSRSLVDAFAHCSCGCGARSRRLIIPRCCGQHRNVKQSVFVFVIVRSGRRTVNMCIGAWLLFAASQDLRAPEDAVEPVMC